MTDNRTGKRRLRVRRWVAGVGSSSELKVFPVPFDAPNSSNNAYGKAKQVCCDAGMNQTWYGDEDRDAAGVVVI
ncbi:hypothetical protein QVD17_30472 [Tagetes erecta]|uniref:Uncharacterized protein n=1 Tax=Tagetes erecta TaxID=13708 RepID=A0AAD8NN01_TARER|nr:hypothetical protein QVD17_30472 [Tagetes erecta]